MTLTENIRGDLDRLNMLLEGNIADKNGLLLSNHSASGYKGVTIVHGYNGFIPYVNVRNKELQELKKDRGFNTAPIGFYNVQKLWNDNGFVFSDVRDAAFIAQEFEKDLEDNLLRFYDGDTSMIATPPKWVHEPDPMAVEIIQNTKERQATGKPVTRQKKSKKTTQEALYDFFKAHPGEYKVSKNDAPKIRASMEEYLSLLDRRIVDSDFEEAARIGFEPYKK